MSSLSRHTAPSIQRSRHKRRKSRRNAQRRPLLRSAHFEQFEPRYLFAVAPQLLGIVSNTGDHLVDGQIRSEAVRELLIRFDEGQRISEASAQNGGIQFVRAGGDGIFGDGDDLSITPNVAQKLGWIGLGDRPNEIVVRFTEQSIDDLYQIRIVGSGASPLRNEEQMAFNNGVDRTLQFELDLGPQILAIVPQPIKRMDNTLVQARNEIEVYFNDDDLDPAAAANPEFYQLIRTRETAENLDDGAAIHPVSVVYDAAADRARLIFADDLASLDATESVYRLRLGNQYGLPEAPVLLADEEIGEAPDTFTSAIDVNAVVDIETLASTVLVQGEIRQVTPYELDLPGGNHEPGHRDLPAGVDSPHVGGSDGTPGITQVFYNFRDDYGRDPPGNPLFNLITPAQRQRAREVFAYYSHYLGVQFVETGNQGVTIATGDLRAVDPMAVTGPGGITGIAGGSIAVMDGAEDWGSSEAGGAWFQTAMHEIGHVLGLGHSYDLPARTIQGDDGAQGGGEDPSFPGDHDVVHGRHVLRPESTDIDIYRFTVDRTGVFSAESVAERLGDASLLDTVLWVFGPAGELIARNDDYFSEDSFVELELQAGDYYVAVTSTGISEINPRIPGSGFGGTTEGNYELRLNFEANPQRNPTASSGIVDRDGQLTLLDGDGDGKPGGEYNFWFIVASAANTFFVDKSAANGGNGSLASPFNNINAALTATSARNNDSNNGNDIGIVRIVGNGGADGDVSTASDNLAFQIGFDSLGQPLADGATMQVPRGVTVMIDAGAIFQLRRANIDVGSKAQGVDHSLGHLQVLGTPRQRAFFTSYHNRPGQPETPRPGDWGGIVFRNELDNDARRGRVLEHEGIFVNYVNHADFSYGGGEVVVNGVPASFSPIQLNEARPALTFNRITNSAKGAIAADPNSFDETRFSNVGRDFVGRATLVSGVVTIANGVWPDWATAGQTITIGGVELEIAARVNNGQLLLTDPSATAAGLRDFVLSPRAFAAEYGRIGPQIYGNDLSNNTINGLFIQVDTFAGQILDRLEVAARFDDTDIAHVLTESLLIMGTPAGPAVQIGGSRREARPDGRLAIDPGLVVKLDHARIETEIGAQLIAEGSANNRVVFTSLLDVRYGGRGTFATQNVDLGPFSAGRVTVAGGMATLLSGGIWPVWAAGGTMIINGRPHTVVSRISDTQLRLATTSLSVMNATFSLNATRQPAAGDWAGLVFGPLSQGSLDHVLITYAGGTAAVEGGFASFNPLEIQQAEVRLTHSLLEHNDGGRGAGRGLGRFDNDDAVVYVRAAQPVILDNIIRDNNVSSASAISINVNALNSDAVSDVGRSRGPLGRDEAFVGNRGALVRNNILDGNSINGMRVRGSTLTTQSVWDDVDVVHVLLDEVLVQNHHTFSGLRLQSSATQSLVIKLAGPTAGITAAGVPLDIDDRIGGSVWVLGAPGHPVVLTSLFDDTVGAGLNSVGQLQRNTAAFSPAPPNAGDWRSIRFDRYSNDRNVGVATEREEGDSNGNPDAAQTLGELASTVPRPGADPTLMGPGERGGDDNRRLGFEVHGQIAVPGDVDVYTFKGRGGQEVWFDIDRTTHALDTVIELIDASGVVLARSNDSVASDQATTGSTRVYPLQRDSFDGRDLYTTNPRDAGMRLVLPGPVNALNDYYVRVRSNVAEGGSLDNPDQVNAGQTSGVYQLQLRLRQIDEVPGSTVLNADIRFATNGVELLGVPGHSPLLGESFETSAINDDQASAQDLGNVLQQDRGALSVGGALSDFNDVDWYQIQIDWQNFQDIPNPAGDFDNSASIIFDFDYADGAGRPDTNLALFDDTGRLIYTARNSNVSDDQPSSAAGSDKDDLSRGSFGAFDPYLGPVHLRENDGKTYFLAVSSDSNLPEALRDPRVRLEPILAQDRLIDDRVGSSWFPIFSDEARPRPGQLFPVTAGRTLNSYADPWHLGDVVLFVHSGNRLWTVDPFTGQLDTDIGPSTDGNADLAMQTDGVLLGFNTDGETFRISTEDATGMMIGDDGIQDDPTYQAFTVVDQGNSRILVAMDTANNIYSFSAASGTTNQGLTGTDNDPLLPVTGLLGVATGLARIGTTIYGVTDAGQFFRVDRLSGAATVIATHSIPFSGLSRGPLNVEGGAFANRLFATDSLGNVHAIEITGALAPIFVDGKTSVPTGISGLTGLAFSTLDFNLWHVTNQRGGDDGHGLDPTPDGEFSRRNPVAGGASFWFGLEQGSSQPGVAAYQSNSALYNTYNLPGGAHGTLTTDTFSLAGYAPGDAPTFYFTYRAQHDDALDSFRVYISNDGANWSLLDQTTVPPRFQNVNPYVANLVNDAQWRQARVDLSPFTGLDNLRIRFDLNTLGGRDLGIANYTGTPLAAIPGVELSDGDSFTLVDPATFTATVFEFDMGFGLRVPYSGAIDTQDGDTLSIDAGAGLVTFEFDVADDGVAAGNEPIVITRADAGETVAAAIETAITGAGIAGLTVQRSGQRLGLEGAADVQQSGDSLLIEGDAPGTLTNPNAIPIAVHPAMTAEDVATTIGESLDAHYSVTVNMNTDDPNLFTSVKVDREAVYVIGKNVFDAGPLFIPLFGLPGDYRILNPSERAEQGRDNNFEGVYLDDFVIGFAERGEVVSGAQVDATFVPETMRPVGKVLEGAYQFEIRRGFEYGMAGFNTQNPYFLNLSRGFATNDHLTNGITLEAPDPGLIPPGATFTIDDGLNRRTFEFNLTGDPASVSPGNVSLNVSQSLNSADVALVIAQALNGDPMLRATVRSDPGSPVLHLAHAASVDAGMAPIVVTVFTAEDKVGDQNIFRDQGQVLIHNNSITNSQALGIRFEASPRDPNSNAPHPGPVRNLIDFNTARLAPSISIANNLIATSGTGGILFSGDAGGIPPGAVPFGRIYNNTIYGGNVPTGYGVSVAQNASPTLLNNVFANLAVGVSVDASSSTTQIGSSVYHRNAANTSGVPLGALSVVVPPGEQIFVDAANGSFYPSPRSRLIDSARDSLEDRLELTSISNPIGIPASPILSPDRDMLGQQRVDDGSVSNTGVGQNPFKDRGAIERADFSGPTAALVHPMDNDPQGRDLNPADNSVRLGSQTLTSFAVRITDGVAGVDPGVGVHDVTVTAGQFSLFRDGALLREGVDYVFSYDALNNLAQFVPAAGTWAADRTYVIQLNNGPLSGIKDIAGNALRPNELSGLTRFEIELTSFDFGDAPDPSYPTLFMRPNGQPGAFHAVVAGLSLGPSVTPETEGRPSGNADADSGDDGVVFSELLPDQTASVIVDVERTGIPSDATTYLNAWIDFNANGDWDDAGEQVFRNAIVVAGQNDLTINVPLNAIPGATFARFRLSTQQDLTAGGGAADGEVEDYRIELLPLVRYELQLNYANSAQQLFRDGLGQSFVTPGLEITAEVFVRDARTAGAAGVRQAFADLVSSNDIIEWSAQSLEFGPLYTTGQAGTVDNAAPPQVNEAGAIAPDETGGGSQLLFRVTGVVKQTAAAESTFTVMLDPADESPAHDTLLFDSQQPMIAAYESETVIVKQRSWQNARHPVDVNADANITVLDALVVINRLNTDGPAHLDPTPISPDVPQPFYDVNGDGNVTVLDALIVINHLNSVGPGPVDDQSNEQAVLLVSHATSLAATGDATLAMAAGPIAMARAGEALPAGSAAWLSFGFDVTPIAISVVQTHATRPVYPVASAADKTLELRSDHKAFSGEAGRLARMAILVGADEDEDDVRRLLFEDLALAIADRRLDQR